MPAAKQPVMRIDVKRGIVDTKALRFDSLPEPNRSPHQRFTMQSSIAESFAAAVVGYNPSRLSRMRHSPIRLLYSKCLELYARKFHVPVWRQARTFWGDEMMVVFPERVSMTLYRYRFFERGLTQIMLSTLKPGMVFFDVGAHFGYYSLLGSTLVGKEGSVHSFEPTPSTFEVLQRNTISKPNIRTNKLAMWSTPETLQFRDFGVTYSAFNSIQAGGVEGKMWDGVEGLPCTVTATSVDEYVRETGVMPNVLKLDAEGAELNIVEGMTETIDRAHPILTVEVGDAPSGNVSNSRDLLDILIAKGYKPFEAQDGEIVPHELLSKYAYENILLMPA
jgi:FkbM family methyltransferase